MRCNRHLSDLSSRVGVCASCLRERLLALIAAQVRQQALAEEDRRKSDAHPPPLIFPRSVSPYICRRSDDSSWNHLRHNINHKDQLFYSTPQVGPTFGTRNKKKHSKFSLISSLFRSSRSDDVEPELDPDPGVSRAYLASSTSSPISSSWLSSLFSGRRKKQSRLCSNDETVSSTYRRPCRTGDRRMSPCVTLEVYEDDEGSPSASGYSSESSQGRRKAAAAMKTPARRRVPPQHNRNVSGLAFCLSPLVRASPNRQWNQKESSPAGIGFSGEIGRRSNKSHLSTASSLCANRSRKLADIGKYNSYHS